MMPAASAMLAAAAEFTGAPCGSVASPGELFALVGLDTWGALGERYRTPTA
jgi:hypothetical protein